jgi:hypothetical protein
MNRMFSDDARRTAFSQKAAGSLRELAALAGHPGGRQGRRFIAGFASTALTPARFTGLLLFPWLKPKKKRPVEPASARPPRRGPGRERPGYRPFGMPRERGTVWDVTEDPVHPVHPREFSR